MVVKLIETAASPAKNRQYQQQWVSFVDFHQKVLIPFTLPASANTVAMFAAHLQQRGLKCSTIQTYLSAISNKHKLENLIGPTGTYLVAKPLQGIKNAETKEPLQRLPIIRSILHQILDTVPFCTTCKYTQTMLRALFLLTYYSCLRVGESVGLHSNERAHTLTIDHITQVTDIGYQITFTSYKHSHTETPTFLLRQQPNTTYCPVSALRQYLQIRGQTQGPIFVDVTTTPLTRDKFTYHLKLCLRLAGLSTISYTTHSFRIGRATQLAMKGASEATIKATGRWKSNAYNKYIPPSSFMLPT